MIQTHSHVSTKNQLMNNGYKLEMWLKDRVCAGVLFLGKTRDSVVKSIQDIVHFNPLRSRSQRIVTTEHLPETFANEIMCSKSLLAIPPSLN